MAVTARPRVDDLLDLIQRPPWHSDAACRQHSEIDFFAKRGRDVPAAKAICASCPVAPECLAWALQQGNRLVGIWGGTTHKERRTLVNKVS